MSLKTCVLPEGRFYFGIHKPKFEVKNLRNNHYIERLGTTENQTEVTNRRNFPHGNVKESNADWIFEIPNPFPFRGTTFIARRWAEQKVDHPESIELPIPQRTSYFDSLHLSNKADEEQQSTLYDAIKGLPQPLQIALASSSTDFRDLICLAKISCDFDFAENSASPSGLKFRTGQKTEPRPVIHDHVLFEVVANSPFLPDDYKEAMVLRPGIQGNSEIIGEWQEQPNSHIFEYLRRNSYIPWGHYAANMANDAVRYDLKRLSFVDMRGLRHLYYQRTFTRLAELLGINIPKEQELLTEEELEAIRHLIVKKLSNPEISQTLKFDRTLWGWNFGFDFAPSHYRLHASHQQIHQQYAMIPESISCRYGGKEDDNGVGRFSPFACGDLIEDFTLQYKQHFGASFFEVYINAIRSNKRLDGRTKHPQSLIIYENEEVIVFVPKAQTSQWELQLMTIKPVGNIVEADLKTRSAIDQAMYVAVSTLSELGARMITSIEYSKKLSQGQEDQRLLYAFLPKLPESPGAFSEAQLRWINGHYPEDFAEACRLKLHPVLKRI